jgi:hypothetical protein
MFLTIRPRSKLTPHFASFIDLLLLLLLLLLLPSPSPPPGPSTRFVLIFDIWHPDFTPDEVRFIDTLYKARFRAERRAAAAGEDGDSFYSVLEKSKFLLDNADWWGEWGR